MTERMRMMNQALRAVTQWMDQAGNFISSCVYFLRGFVEKIPYQQIFFASALLFMVVFCLVRLITLFITLLTNKTFGREYRITFFRVSRRAYWFSIFLQFLIWLVCGEDMSLNVVHFDWFFVVFCFGLTLLALVFVLISIPFRRGGMRLYIIKMLLSQVGKQFLMTIFLLLFTWFFFDRTHFVASLFQHFYIR